MTFGFPFSTLFLVIFSDVIGNPSGSIIRDVR